MKVAISSIFVAALLLGSFPASALEPWHDYYTAKARAQKAEKACEKAAAAEKERKSKAAAQVAAKEGKQ